MKPKTIIQWFEKLNPKIRKRAVNNFKNHRLYEYKKYVECHYFSFAIMRAFTWSETPEGSGYWADIYDNAVLVEHGEKKWNEIYTPEP